jgi:outer membrane protein OmpA-like peptidoglycan-associated protein
MMPSIALNFIGVSLFSIKHFINMTSKSISQPVIIPLFQAINGLFVTALKCFVCLCILGINARALFAQHLVPNGGFESSEQIECLYCALESDKFTKLTKNWDDLNSNPILCRCDYTQTRDEEKYNRCQIQAYKGCNMMEMQYVSRCTDFKHETKGCSSYLGTKLSAALEVGTVYEVSFWVYITSGDDVDPQFAEHIGISLFQQAIRNPDGKMLHSSGFLLDTVIYNQWYKASWKVRPICRLEYLVIGVHRGQEWPKLHHYEHGSTFFYIDEVRVVAVEEQPHSGNEITPYCKPSPLNKNFITESIEGVTCYFETGKSILTEPYKAELDSFALWAKSHPYVAFTISGHTDSVGGNHKQLAQERIQSVLDYLENTHHIPAFRFFKIAAGDEEHVASNTNMEGRRLNRRVEIRQNDYSLPLLLYREVITLVENNAHRQAYVMLNKWLNIAPHEKKILPLFDPRIEALQAGPGWKIVKNKIRKAYKQVYKQPERSFFLDSMWAEDQRYRTLKYYVENLSLYVPSIDDGDIKWEVNFPPPSEQRLHQRDSIHFAAVLNVIGTKNWLRSSDIGERPEKGAFLIVNHQLDTLTLAHFLPLIKTRCLQGESQWIYYATMYDRLQTLKGNPQKYGTQYRRIDNTEEYEPFPLEDEARVNQWRIEIGLQPLSGFD